MSVTFKISNDDGTDLYDFISTGSKIRYITGTFQDQVNHTDEDKVMSFKTIAKGTASEIRTAFNDIETLLHKINIWNENKSIEESMWLNVQSEGTEKERRTLLKSWSRTDSAEGVSDPLLDKSVMVISSWEFARHHAWEALFANRIQHTICGISCNTGAAMDAFVTDQTNDHDGFQVTETADFLNDGNKPGRIVRTMVPMIRASNGDQWDKLWIGMKAVRSVASAAGNKYRAHIGMGSPENAVIGVAGVDLTVVDTTALHDNKSTCGLQTTPAWNIRMFNQIPFSHVDSSVGTYLILARMKVTTATSTVARCAMFSAWNNFDVVGGTTDTYDDVYVDSEKWHMYEMGVIQIPPDGFRAARRLDHEDLYALNLGLYAELVSGSGDLDIDYMCWIPQEHFVYAASIFGTEETFHSFPFIYTTEDDEILGVTHKVGFPWAAWSHQIASKNWNWPADPDKKLIVVALADTKLIDGPHEIDKSIELTVDIIPRYYSYNAD